MRGEAIAGILVILVNIGGGFVIGVFQQDLPLLTADPQATFVDKAKYIRPTRS